MSSTNGSNFYLDFQHFGELKSMARNQSSDAAKQVAQQFEGLFVQQMLATMRSASKIEGSDSSSYMEFYQEMYDKQLAQTVAGQDRLGIARMLMQQMPSDVVKPTRDVASLLGDLTQSVSQKFYQTPQFGQTQATQAPSFPLPPNQFFTNPIAAQVAASQVKPVPVRPTASVSQPIAPQPLATQPSRPSKADVIATAVSANDFAEVERLALQDQVRNSPNWHLTSAFVADIWPKAQQAADQLGTSPKILVAQAALETGWGQHTLKHQNGRDSFNLFGIKAGPQWQGERLSRPSLEYRDGLLHNEVSSFRSYASNQQSLSDYVDFIHSNPRYQQALSHVNDDQNFIRSLHSSGYATDPAYADKVIDILNGDRLRLALSEIEPGVLDHA